MKPWTRLGWKGERRDWSPGLLKANTGFWSGSGGMESEHHLLQAAHYISTTLLSSPAETLNSHRRTHMHKLSHLSITRSTHIFTHLIPKFIQHIRIPAQTSQKHGHMGICFHPMVKNIKLNVPSYLTTEIP